MLGRRLVASVKSADASRRARAGGNRFGEEHPHMRSRTGAGAHNGDGHAELASGGTNGDHVVVPARTIEVDRAEPARVVGAERVGAEDVPPAQVRENRLIVQSEKRLVGTAAAANLRFSSDTGQPFVPARGREPRLARPGALPPHRVHVVAAAKEPPEEPHLGGG